MIYDNAITQTLDFENQLNIGIRYFDLRIALLHDELYYLHAMYGERVMPTLRIIKNFLEKHKSEIVILDFQKIYGMSNKRKASELTKIKLLFNSSIAVLSLNEVYSTLRELRKNNINTIIIWKSNHEHTSVPIKSPYYKTRSVSDLFNFISNKLQRYEYTPCIYVSQLILFPNDILEVIKQLIFDNGINTLKEIALWAESEINEYISTADVKFRIIIRDFVDYGFSQLVLKRNFY